ncbi:MAG: hypothetical protein ABIU05_01205 [Nitrospirales bacterium]
MLQTISPVTETPELAAFSTFLANLPADWNSFVSQVLPGLPSLGGLGNVGNPGTLPEGIRVYDEMKREFSASLHGRRDAFRALLRAVKAARELVYIEGAAFTGTAYGADTDNDLVAAIQGRLNVMPGLRVILCLSSPPASLRAERRPSRKF